MLIIYVDADACPVKQEVYRVAKRYQLDVVLVANSWLKVPDDDRISLKVVNDDLDAADNWIVNQIKINDIAVTSDIPLASRCLQQGAKVISPIGKLFDDNNIAEALATRDLLSNLRGAGKITGGPPPINKKDKSRFLQQFDQMVQSILHEMRIRPDQLKQ